MTTALEVVGVGRCYAALTAVGVLLMFAPPNGVGHGSLAMVGAVAAALTIAVLVVCLEHRHSGLAGAVAASGPISDERRLHGAFRRLSSPDAPGRPQPRAPGAGSRPA